MVGPVFACIIAQQFSNLRKGDRFWYENGGFKSSFTPAQLQSIRQVNFAQIICRSLGEGTLQPHVFLPHTMLTNGRSSCGLGDLTPIDLSPWLERDPFIHKDLNVSANNFNDNNKKTSQQQMNTINRTGQLVTNSTNISNKLDFQIGVKLLNSVKSNHKERTMSLHSLSFQPRKKILT